MPVIAFPCDQFHQELPTHKEIKDFVHSTFHITEGFHLMAKVDVNGPHTHPVFTVLKQALPKGLRGGTRVGGNFNEWLVDERGVPVEHAVKRAPPVHLEPALSRLLQRQRET